ncbi:MAG: class I SAM-dependent methyltransferase [Anaerolineales bacterium]|nr:class I SAM-dependent methyltransferase [Anaerolineales bacterium]
MYNDIVAIYDQIFPLNQAFLAFLPAYLGTPGSRVLDLGCGPGDYVDHLSRAQYQAAGIDNSAEMIRQAQIHKQGTFYNFSFTEIDQLEGPFDCIYCIGNSLSYLPSDLLQPFLQAAARLLNERGYFLIQVVNWDKYRAVGASDFPPKTLLDGRIFHRRYEEAPNSSVIFHTELREEGKVIKSWSDMLYPKEAATLSQAVSDSGLAVVDIFGDYQKAPFEPLSSPATILAAQK